MPTAHHTTAQRLRSVISLDVRSLAVLRMALGALLLVDLAIRCVDFTAMYTDKGFAPTAFVRGMKLPWQWSLHLVSGDPVYQAALFAAAGVLAAMMLIGCQTRLATVGSWLLLVSLHVRLPVVLNAGDTLLRMLLFWGMFLPLGQVWSIDAHGKPAKQSPTVASTATIAYILQLAIVYWAAGWAKWNDDWLAGRGLHDALMSGLYSLPAGQLLARFPNLTYVLSVGTVWLEILAPCLLFLPWGAGRVRIALIATFIVFHLAIAATVTVGLFSYVAIAAWLAMLPTEFWNRLRIGVITDAKKLNAGEPQSSSTLLPLYRDRDQRSTSLRRLLPAALVGLSLAVVLTWNLSDAAGIRPSESLRNWLRAYANATGLWQSWGLFGKPPQEHIWYVYDVRLKDGRQLDLLSRQSGDQNIRPELPSQHFANHRWRKLHWRLRIDAGEPYRQPLAEYIARRWNETHDAQQQIVRLNLYCYFEPFATKDAGGQTRQLLAQVVLADDGGNFADAARSLNAF